MTDDRARGASRRRRRRAAGPGMASLGLYRPGEGILHQIPALAKVLALTALSVAVIAVRGPWVSAALVAVAAATLALAQPPVRATARGLVPVLVLAAVASGYQAWRGDSANAVEVGADLLTLVLAATALTVSTQMEDLLDILVRAARPLRRWLPGDAVALAVALMLRTVPALGGVLAETRDAARARGLGRDPRALLIPAVIRTVARAQATGQALAARGIGE